MIFHVPYISTCINSHLSPQNVDHLASEELKMYMISVLSVTGTIINIASHLYDTPLHAGGHWDSALCFWPKFCPPLRLRAVASVVVTDLIWALTKELESLSRSEGTESFMSISNIHLRPLTMTFWSHWSSNTKKGVQMARGNRKGPSQQCSMLKQISERASLSGGFLKIRIGTWVCSPAPR